MALLRFCFLPLLLLCWAGGFAQQPNWRQKTLKPAPSQRLDSLSIVPGTLVVKGFDTADYQLNAPTATLIWKSRPLPERIELFYRVFPLALDKIISRYSFDSAMNRYQAVAPPRAQEQPKLFQLGNLQYNGALGRSLSFGNSQDAVFNSQLNLQLSGYIGDSIYLSAALADNNIPIQPDGTTAQLNEFDRILLSFRKKGYQLSLGDVDLRQNSDYFLSFYKRLQGVSYEHQVRVKSNLVWQSLASAAVAKGKFARNIFQGLEGNQGPYRLTGANGELFFIVLANTEKVFIDGEQMQRGEDQDYTINYNTAEIVFMPRRMITKDRRIQVEFEYADRNYLNAMLYTRQAFALGSRTSGSFAIYHNGDAANSPINQPLDARQRQFLANIGDSVNQAFYPFATRDTFSASKILYKQIPAPAGALSDSIFVYSTSPDSAFFRLNFVFTGQNQGNYIPLQNAANGRVFQWVPPLSGVPQGSYEPATFLVTPKTRQVFTGTIRHALTRYLTAQAELAASRYDANQLSSKDKGNDKDLAGRLQLLYDRPLTWKTYALKLRAGAAYEWAGGNFTPVERLRSPEFYRNWGLDLLPAQASERLPGAFVQLGTVNDQSFAQASWQQYQRGDGFLGNRYTLNTQVQQNGWLWTGSWEQTLVQRPGIRGQFLRPSARLEKTLTKWRNLNAGAAYTLEQNVQRANTGDTVLPLSFSFYTATAWLRSDTRRPNQWQLIYFTRADRLPEGKQLPRTDQSHNYTVQTTLAANPNRQLRLQTTYRVLTVQNQRLTTAQAERSLVGRLEYQFNETKGFVTGNALYELGSGQEQRRDVSYAEVPAGRGEFTWNDYNGDGIPQLNEFETARFADQAKYIRLFTPTNSFVKAGFAQLNYSVQLQPRALLAQGPQTGWRKQLSRFNLQSALQASARQISDGISINPFAKPVSDTALIGLLLNSNQTLSYNRFSPVWGLDLLQSSNFGQQLLTYGIESRRNTDWQLRGRYTWQRKWTGDVQLRSLRRTLATPAFANRNYQIDGYGLQPRVTWVQGSKWRIAGQYELLRQTNTLAAGESSTSHALTTELRFNWVNNASLLGRFTSNRILFEGDANSTTGFVLLNGLQPGRNYLVTLELTKRFINNLEVTILYEGRQPGDVPFIHRGTAALRAIL